MGVFLQQGKFAVTVENPLARGFEVLTPGMKYTDLGTEFGVSVAKNGEQEVHVFRGRVQAEAVSEKEMGNEGAGTSGASPDPTVSSFPPLVLTANQAIRVAAPSAPGQPSKPIEPIETDQRSFFRRWPESTQFELFNTGVGLNRGAADPHWEIAQVSTDPSFKPQPAIVVEPYGFYARDYREKFQWISDNKNLQLQPGGCRWTLRTHFVLNGLDPSTAHIAGRVSVDDFVVEVRLNGKSLPIPKDTRREGEDNDDKKWLDVHIDEGFVAGDNTLEFVIENTRKTGEMINAMAFCADLKGKANPWRMVDAENQK
jgi:hypothetical protein